QLRDFTMYWIALALAAAVLALIVWLLRSRYGLALKAIRDAELAASCSGVDVYRTKFLVYVITALATAMPGAEFLPKPSHLSGRCVFGQRLDRFCHFHHRDRRHRPHRGSDRRHAHFLRAAPDARRSRHDLPDDAGARGYRHHARGAQGHLGLDRGAVRLA